MRPAAIRPRGFVVKVCSGLMREAAGHYPRLQDPRIVQRMDWPMLAILLAGSVQLKLLVQTRPFWLLQKGHADKYWLKSTSGYRARSP